MEQSTSTSHNDLFKNSLKDAILAPASNMLTIEDFEASFDAVQFHLDIALKRAVDPYDQATVQQMVHQLFNLYIQIIVRLITQGNQAINEEYLKQMQSGHSFAELLREYDLKDCIAIVTLDTLRLSLIGFIQKLFRDSQLKRRAAKFYVQVGRSYCKIALSPIYSDNYSLIRNAIDRHTMDIIQGIILCGEFEYEGVEFVANLKARGFKLAAKAEYELTEGYRKSLATGLKFFTRLIKYAYINLIIGCVLSGFILVSAFNSGSDSFFSIVVMVGAIAAMRYYWRFGPKIADLKTRINSRTKEIRRRS